MDLYDGDSWAAVIALIALAVTVVAQWRSDRLAHYGELDRMYLDLLAMAVQRPYLRDPEERARLLGVGGSATETAADIEARYRVYAYLVWTFLETIHDRLDLSDGRPARGYLRETWTLALQAEHRLHRPWLERDGNEFDFKKPFVRYIRSRSGHEWAWCFHRRRADEVMPVPPCS